MPANLLTFDLIGKRFGRLVVLSLASPGGRLLNCKCDCGTERVFLKFLVVNSRSTSCGCFQRENLSAKKRTHGHRSNGVATKLYDTWRGMKKRCLNPTNSHYASYGGRGITICERWLGEKGFVNFAADMGEPPTPKHQIDRINNDGNYEPGNVRWATSKVQGNNRRTNIPITHNGETLTIVEWDERLGMGVTTLHRRIAHGWDIRRAIETPVNKNKGNQRHREESHA